MPPVLNPTSSLPRVTRLAPSPTGALHLGNARTFLITWAMARQNGWRLPLRIEDLDGPRVKPEAAQRAIDDLTWLGIDWDGPPMYQSHDLSSYRRALRRLYDRGLIYPCTCTRKEIERAQSAPHADDHELRYAGTCRPVPPQIQHDSEHGFLVDSAAAWRFRVPESGVSIRDELLGHCEIDVQREVGDFVVASKQGLPAYQLAVVVDDAAQGVTDVVRGDDLLPSAARQVLLYEALGLTPLPRYHHLPLVLGPDGRRLAKRHGDTRITSYREAGVEAGRVISLLAGWSGIDAAPPSMTAAAFADAYDPRNLPAEPVVMSEEEHRGLLGR